MRIYNATNSQIDVPLLGNQRLSIDPHSVSGDFLGTTEFLTMLITSYDTNELALVVSGPYELNVCANIPTATNYVVQSLDEAIIRFNVKKEEKVEPVEENSEKVEENQTKELLETPVESESVEESKEESEKKKYVKKKFKIIKE